MEPVIDRDQRQVFDSCATRQISPVFQAKMRRREHLLVKGFCRPFFAELKNSEYQFDVMWKMYDVTFADREPAFFIAPIFMYNQKQYSREQWVLGIAHVLFVLAVYFCVE